MIIYPLTLPTSPNPERIVLKARSVVAMARSPFTGQQQTQEHQGSWWEAEISLPPMERDEAEAWISFLLQLRGMNGTFLLPLYAAKTPRGVATGLGPRVKGAGQTGFVLNTRGWTASQSGILKAGDYLQVMRNYLKSPAAFDAADWIKTQGTITATNIADPEGGTTAERFTPSVGATNGNLLQTPVLNPGTIVGQTFRFGIYMKAAVGAPTVGMGLRRVGTTGIISTKTLSTAWQLFILEGIPELSTEGNLEVFCDQITEAEGGIDFWGAFLDSPQHARLHKVLADSASDANGLATLDLWPRIRQADDFARLIAQNPVGLFRLASNETQWDVDAASFYGLGFSAMEAI